MLVSITISSFNNTAALPSLLSSLNAWRLLSVRKLTGSSDVESFSASVTLSKSSLPTRTKSLSICTQVEVPLLMHSTWVIASRSFSHSGCRESSMSPLWSRSLMTRNISTSQKLSSTDLKVRSKWARTTSRTFWPSVSTQRKLLSSLTATTSVTCTRMCFASRSTSTTPKSRESLASKSQTTLESTHSLPSKLFQPFQTLSHISSERDTSHVWSQPLSTRTHISEWHAISLRNWSTKSLPPSTQLSSPHSRERKQRWAAVTLTVQSWSRTVKLISRRRSTSTPRPVVARPSRSTEQTVAT